MEVSVEQTGTLERSVNVSVPAEVVAGRIAAQLRKIGSNAKVDGFRKGKVPTAILEERYGFQARQDVYDDLFKETYVKALQEEDLEPASGPSIKSMENNEGEAFTYVATFEVYPDVTLKLDGIEVSRPVGEVKDEDVDVMVSELRGQRKEWVAKDGASAEGDQVIADFVGKLDGEDFDGNQGEDVQIELGAGGFLPDFETGLTGVKTGDETSFDVNFPDDYHAEMLQGKTVVFTATVKAVNTGEMPELDDEFVKSFGIFEGGVDQLREQLGQHMEREMNQAGDARVKEELLEKIVDDHAGLELPKAMIEQEMQSLQQEFYQNMGINVAEVDEDDLPEVPLDDLTQQAIRRVTLGLVFRTIIREQKIQPDPVRIEGALLQVAANHPKPQELIKSYRQNPEVMQQIEGKVMEEQVIEWLLEQVKVTEVASDFDDVVNAE